MNKTHTYFSNLAGLAGLALFALAACDKDNKSSSTTQTSSAASQATAAVTTTPEPKAAPTASVAPDGAMGKAAVTWKGVGLSTPESVLHDDGTDTYLVSNIDGSPAAVDGKGFVAKLSPDGTVATLKWIESGKNKVTLNAPKGMAFMGDNLYVADIDTVRIFDRKSGNPVADVKIPGATFLNDVALGTDGRILVTDTGVKPGAKGFEATGTDAVYAIDKDKKVAAIAKSKDLGGPNGICVGGDNKVWVASMGSGEIYSLDMKGKRADVQKMPKGTLDGIFPLGSDLVVSSWDASAVYRGKPGGDFKVVVEGTKSPADIGYDKKRGRVLVPLFTENEVQAYDLK
jgi:glucose/arabinose dehydrogenase